MKKRINALVLGVLAIGVAAPAGATNPLFSDAKSHHWGVVTRNTIGSPVAALRDGPFVPGPDGDPPFGNGSLGIEVSDNSTTLSPPSEKVDFGNELDFFGDPVLALNNVGFRVFQTGENAAISATNMPNIRLEIDPNLQPPNDGVNFTTMVWVPEAAPIINQWSGYIDATQTGKWYFTNGTVAATTTCTSALTCDFAAAKAGLNDGGAAPTILSIAVGKGRDNRWVGAVDGLRLNNTIYDFERRGVAARKLNGHHWHW